MEIRCDELVTLMDEARRKGFDEGRRKGFDEGRHKGFDEGHRKGFDEGHRKGYEACCDDSVRVNDNLHDKMARVLAAQLPDKKITAIAVLKAVSGLGLKEAKDAIERHASNVKE
jgi:flagellar biosynthesis/type III secretory pathway protein FliH